MYQNIVESSMTTAQRAKSIKKVSNYFPLSLRILNYFTLPLAHVLGPDTASELGSPVFLVCFKKHFSFSNLKVQSKHFSSSAQAA